MGGRCLFTNKPLDDKTRIEHTIPRSLCGRIKSRNVTCSEFNEASSQCDKELKNEFILILSVLDPVLPAEFKPGEILVFLDDRIPAIKKDGWIELKQPYIVERSSSGRPKEFYLPDDAQTIKRVFKWFGIKDCSYKSISLPWNTAFIKDITICSNKAAVSILKSILCTIDAILQEETQELITRREEIKPLRDFILDSVSKEREMINVRDLDLFYLGIQLFDQKVFEKGLSFHKYNAKPFEHVVLFSSNAATKTLDAVWNIFSHEVHGIRLATKWNGPAVCGYIANPIFQQETISHKIIFGEENPHLKLQKTTVKGFSCGLPPPSDFYVYPVSFRNQAYYDAICYVEANADQHLINSFRETAKGAEQLTLYDILAARIKRLFKESYGTELEQELKRIESQNTFWKDKPSSILFDNTDGVISHFIQDYREAFSSLAKPFYPPSKLINDVIPVIKKAP